MPRIAILYLAVFLKKGKEVLLILKKNFSYFKLLLIYFFALQSNSIAAEEKKKEAPLANSASATPSGNPPPPVYIPPLPRHVEFPTITYAKEPTIEGEAEVNISKMNFWYVMVLATWNPRSVEITEIINKNFKVFTQRNVGVVGLFSNDSIEAVNEWRKKNNPLFLNEFASRNFLDALKNPKIPSVWLIGNQGEILQKLEMPTKQKMLESVQKVMILTGY